jgi:hypothetical protein
LTSPTRANNIARIRALLAVRLIPIDAIKAATTKPEELPEQPKAPEHPCPCCGSRMHDRDILAGPTAQAPPNAASGEDPDRHLMITSQGHRPEKLFSCLLAPQPATAQIAPMLASPPNSPPVFTATPARTSKEGIATDLFPHPHGSTGPRG